VVAGVSTRGGEGGGHVEAVEGVEVRRRVSYQIDLIRELPSVLEPVLWGPRQERQKPQREGTLRHRTSGASESASHVMRVQSASIATR
jgi:hypothetical protein